MQDTVPYQPVGAQQMVEWREDLNHSGVFAKEKGSQ